MEKTIEFKDVVAFIKKAMQNNLTISTTYRDYTPFEKFDINVEKHNQEIMYITLKNDKSTPILVVGCDFGMTSSEPITIELSQKEELEYKSLVLEVVDYSKGITLQKFNDFFDIDETTDINDLDEEEDD